VGLFGVRANHRLVVANLSSTFRPDRLRLCVFCAPLQATNLYPVREYAILGGERRTTTFVVFLAHCLVFLLPTFAVIPALSQKDHAMFVPGFCGAKHIFHQILKSHTLKRAVGVGARNAGCHDTIGADIPPHTDTLARFLSVVSLSFHQLVAPGKRAAVQRRAAQTLGGGTFVLRSPTSLSYAFDEKASVEESTSRAT